MSEFSQKRLESRILESVSELIISGAIKYPLLSTMTSITRVELAPDNSQARCYVSSALSDKSLDKSVKALNSAAGFIQSRIAHVLRTKNTPRLEFLKDEAFKEGERINSIIDLAMKDIHE